ncbi:MAG: twin-arginine translocase TatA/TatE family subunit [Gemmatimonadota bacterium]
MFGGLGMWELILIFLVVLLLFGAKRLPEIGSSLGKGIREFKGSLKEIENELKVPEDNPRVSGGRESGGGSAKAEAREKEEEGNGEPRRLTTSQ